MSLTSGHAQFLCNGYISRHLFFQGDIGICKKPFLITFKAIIGVRASICIGSKIGHTSDWHATTLAYVSIRGFHCYNSEFIRFVE